LNQKYIEATYRIELGFLLNFMPKSLSEHYKSYDRATSQKMTEHNKSGGDVRKPVRKVGNASTQGKYDRAKFNHRKAMQILKRGDPLTDKDGMPTPAAMQFKRWAEKVPKTMEDVKEIRDRAEKQKDSYGKKLGKSDCGGTCGCNSCSGRSDAYLAGFWSVAR
jgi:transcription initiation factor IIF auxiliary subunit